MGSMHNEMCYRNQLRPIGCVLMLWYLCGVLQTLHQFKESDERCLQCGSLLAVQDQNPIARHFGLQLIETVVR